MVGSLGNFTRNLFSEGTYILILTVNYLRCIMLPNWLVLDPMLQQWLLEDIGRGDHTARTLFSDQIIKGQAEWIVKEQGIIAGLPLASRVFYLLNPEIVFTPLVSEGKKCNVGEKIATISGNLDGLLTGERVALNLAMRLSGIASMTHKYAEKIADLPCKLVDTRKTTPGLRILEKYATRIGGAINHRLGLDDAIMIKDNHISAAGGIKVAIAKIREQIPYPLTIEVETENLAQVQDALVSGADIIMLDNMSIDLMTEAVKIIRNYNDKIKIEASGNITLDTIRQVAETGVNFISSSAPITRSTWLDLSMKIAQ
jgi:nicotinate-nucleotide pyrophosphorylase (carboxylating)